MMRKGLEMEATSYDKKEQQSSQMSLPFDFKLQCNQNTFSKASKAIPTEAIIRNDTVRNDKVHCPHTVLIAAKDTTIPARHTFTTSVISNILPFLPPCHLFIITMTMVIIICQED